MQKVEQNSNIASHTVSAQVQVWDVPTRLFHWSLVIMIALAPLTNKYSDFFWHKLNGYAILTLIVFRLLWGLVGSSTARFSHFIRPLDVFSYLKDLLTGKSQFYLGHNPAGAMMVLLLLGFVAAQAVLGLFSVDDIPSIFEGPFASKISEDTALLFTTYHRQGFNILLVIIGVHVLMNIGYSLFKGDNLIRAMMTGKKPKRAYRDSPAATIQNSAIAAICLLLAIAIVFGGVYFFGSGAFV